jgi:glyoxylase-like metal-dependent hydrolase (beta-lactamase superfamily II)
MGARLHRPDAGLQIMADAGNVALDMAQFKFLDQEEPFDSIHPSLHRIGRLNNNYGLYEVAPGVYQTRGLDLANITFVRGRTGWIVVDPITTTESARASWELLQAHVGEGLPVSAVIYTHTHIDHWGGVRGLPLDPDDIASGRVPIIAPEGFMEFAVSENVFAGNAMNRRLFYQYGILLPVAPHGFRGDRPRGRGSRRGDRPHRPQPPDLGQVRGDGDRRRPRRLPERAEHRSAAHHERLLPRPEGAVRRRHDLRDAAQPLHAAGGAGARRAGLVEVAERDAAALRPRDRGDVRRAQLAALRASGWPR